MRGISIVILAVLAQVFGAEAQSPVTNAGALDISFDTSNGPSLWPQSPTGSAVWTVLPLRSGQVLVGGPFLQVEGLDWAHLARLNADGSLDRTFTARPNAPVRAMAEQLDGKVVIAGEFNGVDGQFRDRVARLEPDGRLDTNFTVRLGLNGIIRALDLQEDGKVVIGGAFHVPRADAPWIHNLIRLETNGTIDFTFDTGTNFFATGINVNHVKTVVALSGGMVMAGGTFTRTNGSCRDYLARVRPDGSVDSKFGFEPLSGPNGPVHCMAKQPEGSIVIGGTFTSIHGVERTNLVRLLPDGSLDESFNPPVSGGIVNALAVDSVGRALVVRSSLDTFGELTMSLLARLDSSGRTDSNFLGSFYYRVALDGGIMSVASAPDGGTFIGGRFGTVDTQQRRRVARLLADPPGLPTFTQEATNLFLEPGLDTVIYPSASLSAPTLFQWLHNGASIAGGTDAMLHFPYPLPKDSGDYHLIASNAFGVSTSALLSITVRQPERPGAVDLSFASTPGANSNVLSLAETSDGKLFVGGVFTQYNGTNAAQIARIGLDGNLDRDFRRATNWITGPRFGARALLPFVDGKVMVAWDPDAATGWISRLNTDGSRDASFAINDPDHPYSLSFPSSVHFCALAQDEYGRILAAGPLAVTIGLSTTPRPVLRMFQDGTVDDTYRFDGSSSFGYDLQVVTAMVAHFDDTVLVGGKPHWSSGTSILKLNSLGHRDSSMQVSLTLSNACTNCVTHGEVLTMTIQPDGKLIVGGRFDLANGIPRLNIARLNPDGSLDPTFTPTPAPNATVNALGLEVDGRILVGGAFTNLGGLVRNRLARLNQDGSVDPSFDIGTGANDEVTTLLVRRDGRIVVGGRFTRFNGYHRGRVAVLHSRPVETPTLRSAPTNFRLVAGHPLTLAPLVGGYPPPAVQWLLNGVPIVGETNPVLRVSNVQVGSSGTYSLVGSNASGISINVVSEVTVEPQSLQAGVVDPTFAAGLGADGDIDAMAVQENGRILVGGSFRKMHGMPRAGIARLLDDGRLDLSFDPGSALSEMPSNNIRVSNVLLQPDGKIIVGGSFSKFNGVTRNGVVRLHANGTVDLDYPNVGGWPLLIQHDGKLLLGGYGPYLRRRNPDGTLDDSFRADTSLSNIVRKATLHSDGRIVLLGDFYQNIAQVMPDGSRDVSFNPGDVLSYARMNDICFTRAVGGGGSSDYSWEVLSVVVQHDAKILVGGVFETRSGANQWNLIRLLPSGARDPAFAWPGGPNYAVRCTALQRDGKIVIGGCFTNLDFTNAARLHIARLNPNGSVDPSFNPGAGFPGSTDGWVQTIALQRDGRIALGGQFSHVDGVRRNNIARLGGDVQMFDPVKDGEKFTTQIATVEGRMYWLEAKTTLSDAEWTVVANTTGDGSVQTLADTGGGNGPRFYRVRAE